MASSNFEHSIVIPEEEEDGELHLFEPLKTLGNDAMLKEPRTEINLIRPEHHLLIEERKEQQEPIDLDDIVICGEVTNLSSNSFGNFNYFRDKQ